MQNKLIKLTTSPKAPQPESPEKEVVRRGVAWILVEEAMPLYGSVADGRAGALPGQEVALSQNYPNPFNPLTAICYVLPRGLQVKIGVYDVRGRLVASLVDAYQDAGEHTAVWVADRCPSGVYFYRLEAGARVITRKMVLLK